MQERNFIPAIGMDTKKFWKEVNEESKKHQADNILIYMKIMLDKARSSSVTVRQNDFKDYGKGLTFFNGIVPYTANGIKEKGWFDRIDEYGNASGVKVEHYIVSSGIREMITGTPISKKFKAIYASSFCYDHHGIAVWPALALNYTTKTQYLFRINKGCLDITDTKEINRFVPDKDRPIPFSNMIYIGDGETDIPCFKLIKDKGGHSIAVYKQNTKGAKERSNHLIHDGRVNFAAPADYRVNSTIDRIIKALIDKVAHDNYVSSIK
jgi:hypothetical protein